MNDIEKRHLQSQIELDHASAIKAAKISKRLVKKTVKLVNNGKPETAFTSFGLAMNRTDPESVTLALNSELQDKDIDVEALVEKRWDGSISDPIFTNVLSVIETEKKSSDHN